MVRQHSLSLLISYGGTLIFSEVIDVVTDYSYFTSELYLSNTHVNHHGSCRVMSLNKRGEVTAKHFLYPAQVRLAVARNQFGALFVYIQSTI